MKSIQDQTDLLTIGIAQIAPVWLNREQTSEKIMDYLRKAAHNDCELVVFGEGLLPGYPFWIERTNGAEFNSPMQKEIHAHYLSNAVQIEAGHLEEICALARDKDLAVMLGCIERPTDRGGHSLYASLVFINSNGEIRSVHRKLIPTHEERLAWSPGDGHGLRTHQLGAFTIGGLNCWENWLPLARASLYGQGEDLHVAVWPGGVHNTQDITRFIAREARSFVVSASGIMRILDIPDDMPHREAIITGSPDILANGGSCIAGPDGSWLVEPVVNEEKLVVATIDYKRIREERHNFDPAGHYSRPDILQLTVNRHRQNILQIHD
jgi:nitrilase